MGCIHHEETIRTPCIHRKLFLPSVLKDALAQCHVFTIGRRSAASLEEENSGSEVDDDQVIILAIRRQAMEAKHRRRHSSTTENLCWVLSPVKGEAFIAAAAAAAAPKEKTDGECHEEHEGTDAFFSANSCLSPCSSMGAGGFAYWEDFGRRTVWEEFCHLEGWPFGLSRKMMLLPPLPRSPSDSWTWCNKPNQMAKMS